MFPCSIKLFTAACRPEAVRLQVGELSSSREILPTLANLRAQPDCCEQTDCSEQTDFQKGKSNIFLRLSFESEPNVGERVIKAFDKITRRPLSPD